MEEGDKVEDISSSLKTKTRSSRGADRVISVRWVNVHYLLAALITRPQSESQIGAGKIELYFKKSSFFALGWDSVLSVRVEKATFALRNHCFIGNL